MEHIKLKLEVTSTVGFYIEIIIENVLINYMVDYLITSGECPIGIGPPVSLNMRPKYSRSCKSK